MPARAALVGGQSAAEGGEPKPPDRNPRDSACRCAPVAACIARRPQNCQIHIAACPRQGGGASLMYRSPEAGAIARRAFAAFAFTLPVRLRNLPVPSLEIPCPMHGNRSVREQFQRLAAGCEEKFPAGRENQGIADARVAGPRAIPRAGHGLLRIGAGDAAVRLYVPDQTE